MSLNCTSENGQNNKLYLWCILAQFQKYIGKKKPFSSNFPQSLDSLKFEIHDNIYLLKAGPGEQRLCDRGFKPSYCPVLLQVTF